MHEFEGGTVGGAKKNCGFSFQVTGILDYQSRKSSHGDCRERVSVWGFFGWTRSYDQSVVEDQRYSRCIDRVGSNGDTRLCDQRQFGIVGGARAEFNGATVQKLVRRQDVENLGVDVSWVRAVVSEIEQFVRDQLNEDSLQTRLSISRTPR